MGVVSYVKLLKMQCARGVNKNRIWKHTHKFTKWVAKLHDVSCSLLFTFTSKKKKNPLADNQPKNILNYEELTNTGPFNWLFLLLGSWKGHAVTMVSVWIQKKAITCSLVWWGICFNIIIVALTKTWAWRVRSSVSKHLTMKKKKIFNYIYYL